MKLPWLCPLSMHGDCWRRGGGDGHLSWVMLFVRVGINGSGGLLSCWGLLLQADVRLVVGLSEGDVVGPGLLCLLSAKRNTLGRFSVANAPHYSMCCVFMVVMRILCLHINSDFAQLGVPDLLVHTVS